MYSSTTVFRSKRDPMIGYAVQRTSVHGVKPDSHSRYFSYTSNTLSSKRDNIVSMLRNISFASYNQFLIATACVCVLLLFFVFCQQTRGDVFFRWSHTIPLIYILTYTVQISEICEGMPMGNKKRKKKPHKICDKRVSAFIYSRFAPNFKPVTIIDCVYVFAASTTLPLSDVNFPLFINSANLTANSAFCPGAVGLHKSSQGREMIFANASNSAAPSRLISLSF